MIFWIRTWRGSKKVTASEPDKPLGGVEGRILWVDSPGYWAGKKVLKVLKLGLATPDQVNKWKFLAAKRESLGSSSGIVLPEQVLYDDQGNPLGFLMTKANGIQLEQCLNEKAYGKSSLFRAHNRLRLCLSLCRAVAHAHQSGDIVISDLKPQNIIVGTGGNISLVDMDSCQISTKDVFYPASAVTLQYAAPEVIQLHSDDNDHFISHPLADSADGFALAAILYQVLFGIFPFSGVTWTGNIVQGTAQKDQILAGAFPFGIHAPQVRTYARPHHAFPHSHAELRQLFLTAFLDGHTQPSSRPSAAKWENFFRRAVNGDLGQGIIPDALPSADEEWVVPTMEFNWGVTSSMGGSLIHYFRVQKAEGFFVWVEWQFTSECTTMLTNRSGFRVLARDLPAKGEIRIPHTERVIRLVARNGVLRSQKVTLTLPGKPVNSSQGVRASPLQIKIQKLEVAGITSLSDAEKALKPQSLSLKGKENLREPILMEESASLSIRLAGLFTPEIIKSASTKRKIS